MKSIAAAFAMVLLTAWTRAANPVLDSGALPDLPPKTPEEALATFDLDPEFRIELVASEPLIADPVAISFDEYGALFVAEMRGYSERRDEKLGRISRLEDRDGDGRMDHATVYADGLAWPTGVLCFDGGVFVIAAPDLWYLRDTNGDGVADERKVVLTGFGELASRLNVQALSNSLRWGPDQRVYIAEGGNGSRIRRPDQNAAEGLVLRGRDISFNPRTMQYRAESGGGQYGMAFDDFGRKFICSNSRHLMQIAYDVNLLGDSPVPMPPPAFDIAVDGPAAPVFRRSPDEAWRVVRTKWRVAGMVPGPVEGGGTPSGYFTGATGLQIARGNRFQNDISTDRGRTEEVFIADTGSNLVHRKRLSHDGVLMRGERPEGDEHREFLASTDNWFRPVQLENGPGGGLYVVDFYREIIEHPWSLPPGIKEHLDLNRGNDRGRIWCIFRKNSLTHRTVHLGDASNSQLVETLGHENGWHRDTAARLLFERNDSATGAMLREAVKSPLVLARLGALNLLAARGELDERLIDAGLGDIVPGVRMQTLKLTAGISPAVDWNSSPWREHALKLADDENVEVRFTLALVLGHAAIDKKLAVQLWQKFASGTQADPLLEKAIVRLAAPFAVDVVEDQLRAGSRPAFSQKWITLFELAARSAAPDRVKEWLLRQPAGAPKTYVPLDVATGVARVDGLAERLALPAEFKDRLTTFATETLKRMGRAQLEHPESMRQGNPFRGVFKLVEPGRAGSALLPLLGEPASVAIKDAIVEELLGFKQEDLFRGILNQWEQLTPRSRSRVLELAQRNAGSLLVALEYAEKSPGFAAQLGPAFRKSIREHANADIRKRGVALFGEASNATAADRAKQFASALTLPGDAKRGRAIYQSRCVSCHRAGSEGFALGPDLLTVAAAGRESLLGNILDPNREVAPRFEAWSAKLKNGEEATGILADERPDGVTLRVANGVEQVLARTNLSSLASTGKSLMPEGLDDGLTADDMADLLRFIESLAER